MSEQKIMVYKDEDFYGECFTGDISLTQWLNCSFRDCSFEDAKFDTVLWLGCNFCNTLFTGITFEYCEAQGNFFDEVSGRSFLAALGAPVISMPLRTLDDSDLHLS